MKSNRHKNLVNNYNYFHIFNFNIREYINSSTEIKVDSFMGRPTRNNITNIVESIRRLIRAKMTTTRFPKKVLCEEAWSNL